ncbi:tetratricopeptide repeat-containing glycosyltransferase family protein [Burkholderia sp. BCC1988]|uniref:tetratricopeptide repeat-containing glycosyltransferase family protein n=1 Tax=Burkholderia sp. BCC1988 TaxID=2817443 RepID=UPI002AB27973|nr:tetratricopeptide repeat-containing glycosyltransferase family protein [Burkholderia sp. BCC1988]
MGSAQDNESTISADDVFYAAVAEHRAGALDAAERLYRRALERAPDHAEALNNLGVLLEGTRDIRHAEACYRRALSLMPGYVDAHCNLGLMLHAAGRVQEAEACYVEALMYDPECAIAHSRLGVLLHLTGRRADAEPHLRRALACDPNDATTHAALGAVLHQELRYQEAEVCYRQAVTVQPGCMDAHLNLGVLLHETGRIEEAERCFYRTLELNAEHCGAYGNLGNLLYAQQRFGEAERCYLGVLERTPDSIEALNNMGRLLHDAGRYDDAERYLRRALELDPSRSPTAFNLALLLLARGRYEEAWPLYEARYEPSPHWGADALCHMQPCLSFPEWRGESLLGKSLVLFPEQGLGDVVQFARYLPLLKACGVSRLSVVCPPALTRLIGAIAGVDACWSYDAMASLPPHDYCCLVMSLPLRFRTTLQTIPANVPYLHPAPELVSHWGSRWPCDGFKVGLVWAGDSRPDQVNANAIDRRRSFHVDTYLPLLRMDGITFVSLQKDATVRRQLAELPEHLRPVDPMEHVVDFADTAAVIANLDLVISVDTSVAHVAGALGKPVWILSRFDGCWRWMADRDDSPWYPSARLFRQPRPGDWASVIDYVASELSAFASRDPRDVQPGADTVPSR